MTYTREQLEQAVRRMGSTGTWDTTDPNLMAFEWRSHLFYAHHADAKVRTNFEATSCSDNPPEAHALDAALRLALEPTPESVAAEIRAMLPWPVEVTINVNHKAGKTAAQTQWWAYIWHGGAQFNTTTHHDGTGLLAEVRSHYAAEIEAASKPPRTCGQCGWCEQSTLETGDCTAPVPTTVWAVKAGTVVLTRDAADCPCFKEAGDE